MSTRAAVTRRGFLTGGAAALVLPAIVPSSIFGDDAPGNRVTLGHIGVGGQGGGLLRGIQRHKGVQSVAVCDAFRDRRDRWASQIGGKAHADFRDLLGRDDIDGVFVATPDHWHVPIALAAAKAGKDMYVEKPLGLAIQWNLALRRAVRRYQRVFQYGTQQRSSAHCRFGCELVRNGRIGQLKRIEVIAPGGHVGGSTKAIPVPDGFNYDMWLGPAPVSPYTRDRCTSGGSWFVYDNSIGFLGGWGAHPLDIAVWGCEPGFTVPVEVEGTGVIPTEGLYDTVTRWNVRGRYANGVEFGFIPGGNSTKFIGTEGWVRITRGGIDAQPRSLLRDTIAPEELHLKVSRHQGVDFTDCIRSRAETVSPIGPSVDSDIISHLSDIAIRLGRKIRWDPAAERIVGDETATRMCNRATRQPWSL